MKNLLLASIDIGTNSTRLLVARCDGKKTTTVDRRMVITRLGEWVDETRRLGRAALERTEAALVDYRARIDILAPVAVRAVATSALRDSQSGDEFIDLVRKTIGVAPEILTGDEEARLSFLGAVSDLDKVLGDEPGPVLVFDIGGGSTELIVGLPAGEIKARSVDVGCVRMSERFLAGDPPSPVAIGRMESHIIGELNPVVSELVPTGLGLGVGLAGTVTTLSGMARGLQEYDTKRIHHSRLTREKVEDLYQRLAFVSLEERKKLMGLEPGRADVIVGGTAVLRAVMDLAGLDEILVSEKDILDGLVIKLYEQVG